jgi:RNA recognition motif-containing protein
MVKLLNLLKSVDSSPLDKRIWASIFSFIAHSPQEAVKESSTLRKYLDSYVQSFQTGSDFWIMRFAYEKDCLESLESKSEKDLALIKRVYEAGMCECPSWKVALRCVEDAEEFMEDDNLLALIEEALEVCGSDVTAGGLLWMKRLELEADRLEDRCSSEALAAADVQVVIDAAKPFFKVLGRLLAQPTIVIEQALATMEAMCNMIFGTDERMTIAAEAFRLEDLSNKATLALQERALLTEFEGQVAAMETPPEGGEMASKCVTLEQLLSMIEIWSHYAQRETERGNLARARRVYQRAVLCVHEQVLPATADEGTATAQARSAIASLWISYVRHVMPDVSRCQHVSKLALKACYYSRELWEMHFLSLERDDAVGLQRLWLSHSTALQSGLSSAADYSAVLVSFPAALGRLLRGRERGRGATQEPRRKRARGLGDGEVSGGSDPTSSTGRLEGWEELAKEAKQQSKEWLCRCYPDWEDIWAAWALAWVTLPTSDADVKEIMEEVLRRFPTTRHISSLVEQLCKVDMVASRYALDRAVQEQVLVVLSAESTPRAAASLVTFLDLRENLDRLRGDTEDYITCMQATAQVREKCKAQLALASAVDVVDSGHIGEIEAKVKKGKRRDKEKSKEKSKERDDDEAALQVQGGGDGEGGEDNKGDEGEFSDTLRLRNLPFDATEMEVEALLKNKAKVHLARAHSGRPKGVAYAAFIERRECRAVAANNNLELRGRPLQVEQLSKSSLERLSREWAGPQPTTVYVSGLPPQYTDVHVLTLFSHCGDIVETSVFREPGDTRDGPQRAKIQFTDVAGRQEAFSLNKLDIPTSDSTKTRIQVSICKLPLVVVEDPTAASVKKVKTAALEVPYVPPPIVEIKGKPKRAGFMFKPAALR